MNVKCEQIHRMFGKLKRYRYPFDESTIPKNGIYIQFENGEMAHSGDRIVRIGTHDGQDNLRPRLKEHFDDFGRSVFRRKIGTALINRSIMEGTKFWSVNDLKEWSDPEWDTREERFLKMKRYDRLEEAEKQVSKYIRNNISFVCIEINTKEKRKYFEARLISTISNCTECEKSTLWLGNFSTKPKVCKSSLWQEQRLWKDNLSDIDMQELIKICV